MSIFKKFTDFCAGIAAFVGGLFLLQKYMVFKPLDTEQYIEWMSYKIKYSDEVAEEITAAPSKLKQFFTPELINDFDYRLLFILVVTLIISVLAGRIFKRLPYVCFFFSLFPAVVITYTFANNMLYTQKGLFLIVGALHIAGNLVECILHDKEDGLHHLFLAAKISSLFPAALCLLCTKIAEKIPTENIDERLPIFKELAFKMTTPENMELLTKIGWIYFGIFIISILLYNVYFIDAILTIIPLGYIIYALYGELLTFSPSVFLVLAAICFMTHLALCVCENNLSRKEQLQALKEE